MHHNSKRVLAYIGITVMFVSLGYIIFVIAGTPLLNILGSDIKMAIVKGAPDYEWKSNTEDNLSIPTEGTIKKSELNLPKVGERYGTIQCEERKLEAPLYYGDTEDLLLEGAGQYINSSLPGEGGTILVGGHDTTFFAPLEQAKQGDIITITTSYAKIQYKISELQVKDASEQITISSKGNTIEELILYTCYPFGDVGKERNQRYYIYCEKVSGPTVEGE